MGQKIDPPSCQKGGSKRMTSYLINYDCSAPPPALPVDLSMEISFKLDTFQAHAVNAIHRDENVLVTAKTGSGKTFVAEYQVAHSLKKGGRVFYTTPIKSLSNQKFYDLKRMFSSVGIMTGDIKFRPDAQVVIMTTEILRNLLYKQSTTTQEFGITAALSLEGLDAVVFDEVHYINDPDRGRVWEETMILLPLQVKLVLLSATIDSPEPFAEWLGALRQRPIHLLSTQYRVVPLLHGVLDGDTVTAVLTEKETFCAQAYRDWAKGYDNRAAKAAHRDAVAERRLGGYEEPVVKRGEHKGSYKHQMNTAIRSLESRGDLPALFFVLSRVDCAKYAEQVEGSLLTSSDAAAVDHILDFHLHRHLELLQPLEQYHALRRYLVRGIAYHHSGLIPLMKEIIELLFTKGFVKVLFATETFAVGINMPTKTVVFTSYRKFDSVAGMRMLRTDEYIQMAGRAGRRGKDTKGLVLYLPARDPEPVGEVQLMMCGRRAKIQSQMRFGLEFLLKVLHNPELDFDMVFDKSYWRIQSDRAAAVLELELVAARTKLAAFAITEREFSDLRLLTTLQAELKGAVNAARKDVQRRLGQWQNGHMGPRWKHLEHLWPEYQAAERELAAAEKAVVMAKAEKEIIWEQLGVLRELGFVESAKLTLLGRMATEVNEGHPIIMPLIYRNGICNDLTAEEILSVLAVFASDSNRDDAPTLEELSIPLSVLNAVKNVQKIADHSLPKTDDSVYITAVEPIYHWLRGAEFAEVCSECGIYEGNFLRVIMKMGNILEEWRTMATIAGDIAMLEKMRDIQLLRGITFCDSLYLKC
jgi:superfamily II RNA helicase